MYNLILVLKVSSFLLFITLEATASFILQNQETELLYIQQITSDDLNVVHGVMGDKTQTNYENKLYKIIEFELEALGQQDAFKGIPAHT